MSWRDVTHLALGLTIAVIAVAVGFSAAGVLVLFSATPRPFLVLVTFGFITACVACVLGRWSAGRG